jgi:hypothetical protein
MSVEDRVSAWELESEVLAANEAFGVFEPFRRILGGKLRRTAT